MIAYVFECVQHDILSYFKCHLRLQDMLRLSLTGYLLFTQNHFMILMSSVRQISLQ